MKSAVKYNLFISKNVVFTKILSKLFEDKFSQFLHFEYCSPSICLSITNNCVIVRTVLDATTYFHLGSIAREIESRNRKLPSSVWCQTYVVDDLLTVFAKPAFSNSIIQSTSPYLQWIRTKYTHMYNVHVCIWWVVG